MDQPRNSQDLRPALSAHLAAKGAEIFEKYGPRIGWPELLQILADRSCVRYPCEIRFDAGPLLPGEFAYPVPQGPKPEDGFVMSVHPHYQPRLEDVSALVLYQLVSVNYGGFASCTDAEIFGAQALGLPREEYYQKVCDLADELLADQKKPIKCQLLESTEALPATNLSFDRTK